MTNKVASSRKKIKKTTGEVTFDIFNYLLLTIFTLICLYPMLYVLFASFSDGMALTRHSGPILHPIGFSLDAFRHVFRNPNIISGYRNTLFLLIVGVSWSVFMTSLGAYFLAQKNVFWKNIIMFFIVFTMFFQGGMIPLFLTIRNLRLTDSLWGVIFPFSITTFNMIIMRTSFQQLPDSLSESAMIDGAGHIRILVRIALPLSKAIIAVMVLFYGVSTWNGWFWASVLIRDRTMLPLQVILREILLTATSVAGAGGGGDDMEAIGRTIRFATIVVATVPILCVYPLLQKHFTKGVMIGALKG